MGERLGERFGKKLSGSDAKAGAGGARSIRDSGKSGSGYGLVDEKMFEEFATNLGRRAGGVLVGH